MTGGALSSLLAPGRVPGEFYVADERAPTSKSSSLGPKSSSSFHAASS
jgi:hypothetical protein